MEIDPSQILTHAVGFLILLFILRKFAWGSLLSALEARSNGIAQQFRTIEETKKELEKLKEHLQQSLAKIEEEARGKIQAAVQEGRRISMEIEEEARAHARANLEKTKEAVQLEVAKARVELKEQVVDLAIQVTHKVLQQHLDEETDRRMIEAFIKEIG
ncbi:MAG: F0F1 ATP synthase subunit B [Candidatus Omnitrophica bacterium]|nr:F0F1 ATP synthase subunit B [Candidatus Omnitrophota bacterium]